MASVWDRVRFLFDMDDGSLPAVCVTGLTGEGVAAAYAFLRAWANVRPDHVFWHRGENREERLDDWPNPASLVAREEADAFHFLASGLTFGGVTIHDLGVFIFPSEVRLDYRMGPEWDERRVLALFELLRQPAALDPRAQVRLEEFVPPAVEQRFLAAWGHYCQQRAAGAGGTPRLASSEAGREVLGMSTVAFRVVPTPLDYGPGIEIRIDGEDLVAMVRGVELPFAQAEGHPGIAGAYAGLPACVYSPPSRHFWGEAEDGRRDGKVALLTCRDCGESGCWPLLARIEVGPSHVVWSAFEQPHRRGLGRSLVWSYDGFGPFVFDRGQYEEALRALN